MHWFILINLAALKDKLIAKTAELISDGSICSFMKTKECQKQTNQKPILVECLQYVFHEKTIPSS